MTTEHEKITDCVHAEVGRVADDCPWCHNRLLKLLDEKTEIIRSQDEEIKKLELKCQLFLGAIELREEYLKESRSAVRRLGEFCSHDEMCASVGWEAGESTPDGGYRTKIRGKWYQSSPVDETPKCDCGLEQLLEETKSESPAKDSGKEVG